MCYMRFLQRNCPLMVVVRSNFRLTHHVQGALWKRLYLGFLSLTRPLLAETGPTIWFSSSRSSVLWGNVIKWNFHHQQAFWGQRKRSIGSVVYEKCHACDFHHRSPFWWQWQELRYAHAPWKGCSLCPLPKTKLEHLMQKLTTSWTIYHDYELGLLLMWNPLEGYFEAWGKNNM